MSRIEFGNPGLLHLVGGTPLAWIPADDGRTGFHAKIESAGIGGMKARAAMALLTGAAARGELVPGATVVESTSGTMGIGLALAARALGHPVILVVDDELERDMRALFTALGVRLDVVENQHPEGGWQQARLDRLADILAATPGAYWPDQYNNPDNASGYAGMAREIIEQIDRVDVLVATVGSGGHCAGLTRVLRRQWPGLRVIGVDSVGSRIFGQPARQRHMRGLGSSILPRNVRYPDYDEVHWVGPAEAVASCRAVAARTTLAGGWSTGAAALVAGWAARREPGARVLTVFPDGPHRYLRTIYDDEWCTTRGLLTPGVTRPVEIAHPDGVEVDGWARCRVVRDPAGARVPV
ncbi:PLP-dependent cysteine synthase family protein [Nocardia sp. NPDC058058]|uniref:PLP-dependent cysteine synthase family protein n=1 Tax=Nocardia sp. NPDC058058 TaxID=3346317 RepID=UPI0036DEE39F